MRDPAATLGNYVITEQDLAAFDQALGLVKSGLEGQESEAGFLHGSFGSGKSHFMAVLHLLLSQDKTARSHPAPPVFLGETVLAGRCGTCPGRGEFLAKISSGSGEWGDLETWTVEKYERARKAPTTLIVWH